MQSPITEIIEIQGRSEQGTQEPFQCLADDGFLYYVKGGNTDRASLCNEWVSAHLGRHFGLPIPPCRLVHVSDEILAEAPAEWRVLGPGIAFGSRLHPGCTWFDKAQTAHVTDRLQIDIFAYDWWIQNSDRNDGNTNLLWDAGNSDIVVIDHNLAFQPSFSTSEFLANHIFRQQWGSLDIVALDALQARFCMTADTVLAEACDNVPLEWTWLNPEQDIKSNMDLELVKRTVLRCHSSDFWRFT